MPDPPTTTTLPPPSTYPPPGSDGPFVSIPHSLLLPDGIPVMVMTAHSVE